MTVVELDKPTPIVLSLEASPIRGTRGVGALSRCSRF
jgi:hypothetical protein